MRGIGGGQRAEVIINGRKRRAHDFPLLRESLGHEKEVVDINVDGCDGGRL